jgi:DNA (cytosine-5)-methyltransferase 1
LTSQIDFDLWQERLHDPVSLIVLDLFCGAGGMSLGFADEGFVIGAGLYADEQACETFAANFPARALRLNLSDVKCPDDARDVIKRLDLPRVDIIIGGPLSGVLCRWQGTHLCPARRGAPTRTAQTERALRAVLPFRGGAEPLMFVMENVQTMTSWEDGIYFQGYAR